FAGNTNYASANSSAVAFSISQATPTVSAALASYQYDSTAHTATGSATGVGTDGTLTPAVTFSYVGTGTTTYPASPSAPRQVGTYAVTASFAGNSNYNAAASAPVAFSITKATASVSATLASYTYDSTAHAATGSATGVGTDGTLTPAVTFSYVGTGTTTYPASPSAPSQVGTYAVTASFAGNNNYNAAASATVAFSITKASSTTIVTVSNAGYDGASHGGTANVSGAGGLNQTLTVNYSGRNATTYGPSTTAPTSAGDYTASATFAGDSNHNGSSDSKPFSITKKALTATANSFAAPAGGQYSDPLPVLNGTLVGVVSGDGITASYTTTATQSSSPGNYPITPVLSDPNNKLGNYTVTINNGTLTRSKEDAEIEYTGDTLKSTGSTATNSTATLMMAGIVREQLNGVPDAYLGDKLNTTQLNFTFFKYTDTLMATPIVGCTTANLAYQSPGATTGTAIGSCTTAALGADNYTVKVELLVNGFYVAECETVSVTVALGGTGFTTGGGWLTEPILGTRSNLGFTAKYLKNGNVQGNSLYIYRKTVTTNDVANPAGGYLPAGSYNWIIKSNAMLGLTQTGCTNTTPKVCTNSTFTGKSNISAVNRVTGIAYSLGGNYQFQVDVTDNGEPGSSASPVPDRYAIRVWDPSTGNYYVLGGPATAAQIPLAGGNIQVRP
ncbi:MAG: MBG domain-containing protein, partial [Pyrinomonadaceae bacterium]